MNTKLDNNYRIFQSLGLWPRMEDLNTQGWLSNFDNEEDRELARHILNHFIHVPDTMLGQLLITVVGRCGYYLKKINPQWNMSSFDTEVWYSFVEGETPSPTDSGRTYLIKVRDKLHIQENRLLELSTLVSKLNKEKNLIVILVDDFVGTGNQCISTWVSNKLEDVVKRNNHMVFYAPIVVNREGQNRIKNTCPSLHLVPAFVLGPEYNLFEKNSIFWDGDNDLYEKGISLIEYYSNKVGIPTKSAFEDCYWQGLGAQGLFVQIGSNLPDACPPIFYWDLNGWVPLIHKTYKRSEHE